VPLAANPDLLRVNELAFAQITARAPTVACKIVVHKARSLVASDFSIVSKPTSDPYVVVIVDGDEAGRTKTVKRNLNPTFGAAFTATVSPHTSRLRFLVYDWDRATADDPMGEVNVQIAAVASGEPRWYDLVPTGGCKTSGALLIEVRVDDAAGPVALLAGRREVPSAADADRIRAIMKAQAAALAPPPPLQKTRSLTAVLKAGERAKLARELKKEP